MSRPVGLMMITLALTLGGAVSAQAAETKRGADHADDDERSRAIRLEDLPPNTLEPYRQPERIWRGIREPRPPRARVLTAWDWCGSWMTTAQCWKRWKAERLDRVHFYREIQESVRHIR